MPISPYLQGIREKVGNDLLLVPSVAVLPRDREGRVLLVREADFGGWATLGGSIEPDEAPEDAARREALEEAGIVVDLCRLLAVVGGPGFRITYPNGHQTAYVAVVYEAVVESGSPAPDDEETIEVGWFEPEEISSLALNDFNRRLLEAVLPKQQALHGAGSWASSSTAGTRRS